ncbi:hypothetical protein KAFR_0I01080 [Kazachstania africana CBS 2517]|uniref:Large ribosomal subunit protein mL40 n=1 Tax=Kazachstania africana (strain ATCC 22294 / BCRC 22015 / CBS 2517 / CECT 1963 / NBRC 1671 / NRRL Y-8276) TaxID=1071382 RepID=H2AZT9_KAZAF|nr:hypothetical protein KAFR_0I01080 [Kazachstania africana CBS 2517]CCF59889.1 hypothetical protein KAFR_0I01080 [Kazachstania africana CBS 2517]
MQQRLLQRLPGTFNGISSPYMLKPLSFVRNKRTKSRNNALSPQAQRVVTQLSVLSARKKVPKLLKLSKEDLIKHQTITKAWSIYQDIKKNERQNNLKQQYNSINEAMDLLQSLSPNLYAVANVNEAGKKFPLELRVPTDFPPEKLWYYDYKKSE